MARQDARRIIVLRAPRREVITELGRQTFHVTGITVYPLNGGLLEYAQHMAAHEARARPSLMTGEMIRSRSIRSSGSCCKFPETPSKLAVPRLLRGRNQE